ncbi:NAD(+) diphosphatase [Serinibacter arcticus]|uniref:NAD(+) diphosphatase n=1 Tax=Serinibacter arcticus TaxID=1655435 RepID=UPI002E27326D
MVLPRPRRPRRRRRHPGPRLRRLRPGGRPVIERGNEPDGWGSLRDAGHLLGDAEAGLATSAVALSAWRRTHTHCPRCGAPTVLVEAGWAARCDRDGSTHYPRTDPAVIMAISDGADRLLLAHAAAWPERRRSVLAGFVEAGEGLEQAVRREVEEEVGLDVGPLAYAGGQPWPFPGRSWSASTAASSARTASRGPNRAPTARRSPTRGGSRATTSPARSRRARSCCRCGRRSPACSSSRGSGARSPTPRSDGRPGGPPPVGRAVRWGTLRRRRAAS